MKLKAYHLKYYEWSEVESLLVQELDGRDLRDYAGRWSAPLKRRERDNIPHLDFWHWWLEKVVTEPVNDSYQSIVLSEILHDASKNNEPQWVLQILRAMKKVLGKLSDKSIIIHYDW